MTCYRKGANTDFENVTHGKTEIGMKNKRLSVLNTKPCHKKIRMLTKILSRILAFSLEKHQKVEKKDMARQPEEVKVELTEIKKKVE
jgi:DNA-binding HxlR family transcriptional regulator